MLVKNQLIKYIFFFGALSIKATHPWGFFLIKGSNSHYRYTGQTLVIEGTQPAK